MPVLTHGCSFSKLKNLLNTGKILPVCNEENPSKTFDYDYEKPCKKFDTYEKLVDYIFTPKRISVGNEIPKRISVGNEIPKRISVGNEIPKRISVEDEEDGFDPKISSDHLTYISVIFNPDKLESDWNYAFDAYLLIDPEMLKVHGKQHHIHMTLGWVYGNLNTDKTIMYNKYADPFTNLEVLERYYNTFHSKSKKQRFNDIEIVSTEYDIKNYIIGVLLTKQSQVNNKTEIEELKHQYPNLVWLNSIKEFKNSI